MIRAGLTFIFEENPVNALGRYISTGFKAKHKVFKEAKRAAAALTSELEKIPDGAQRLGIKKELSAYISEIVGYPNEERLITQSYLKQLITDAGINLSPSKAASLVDNLVTLTSTIFVGFKPAQGVRDITSTWANYYIRFGGGKENFFTNIEYFLTHPDELKKLKAEGIVPTMTITGLHSQEELTVGALNRTASKFGEGVQKLGNVGLYASLQEQVFELLHASIYTDRMSITRDNIIKFQEGKQTKVQMYDNLNLHQYAESVQKKFDALFENGSFHAAADMLARRTAAEHAVIYGHANMPSWMKSDFGRIAGQFNTWSAWQRSLYSQLLQSARTPKEAAAIVARIAFTQTATYTAGKALGMNPNSWMLHTSMLPNLGPLIASYEASQDPTEDVHWTAYLGAGKNIIDAIELYDRNFGTGRILEEFLGFPVDKTEKSIFDEMTDSHPRLKQKR
jgi:hypothetical protein